MFPESRKGVSGGLSGASLTFIEKEYVLLLSFVSGISSFASTNTEILYVPVYFGTNLNSTFLTSSGEISIRFVIDVKLPAASVALVALAAVAMKVTFSGTLMSP